ncbi:MAG: DUF1987 domain-containing protein [Flavobacteriales bacterium]|nr:DUF1987 domain-containing protein [Flavobacteriales bacterium]
MSLESIYLQEQEYTPKVHLDHQNNEFEISGSSMPENALEFYAPIIQWFETYSENIQHQNSELILNLDYVNSASSKKIADILFILEQINENGHEFKVKWFYLEEDDIMLGKGMIYKDTVNIPFELEVIKE